MSTMKRINNISSIKEKVTGKGTHEELQGILKTLTEKYLNPETTVPH